MLLEKGIDMTLGPSDIRRCHWIYEVLDELKIKNKNFVMLNEDFSKESIRERVSSICNEIHITNAIQNIIILDDRFLSQEQRLLIEREANDRLFIIFGRNKDKELTKLIPEADRMRKWSSICSSCGVDASFSVDGRQLCRECKINAVLQK